MGLPWRIQGVARAGARQDGLSKMPHVVKDNCEDGKAKLREMLRMQRGGEKTARRRAFLRREATKARDTKSSLLLPGRLLQIQGGKTTALS